MMEMFAVDKYVIKSNVDLERLVEDMNMYKD